MPGRRKALLASELTPPHTSRVRRGSAFVLGAIAIETPSTQGCEEDGPGVSMAPRCGVGLQNVQADPRDSRGRLEATAPLIVHGSPYTMVRWTMRVTFACISILLVNLALVRSTMPMLRGTPASPQTQGVLRNTRVTDLRLRGGNDAELQPETTVNPSLKDPGRDPVGQPAASDANRTCPHGIQFSSDEECPRCEVCPHFLRSATSWCDGFAV